MLFKALADRDDGDFSLMERTLPPGGRRPPPHRHTNCSEAYFVLDGLVSVTISGEELTVGPEGFVLVPRHRAHVRQLRRQRGAAARDPRPGHGRVLRRAA
jgi:mannose-6-phosphate isomerase-like protein (cupin superfamily)